MRTPIVGIPTIGSIPENSIDASDERALKSKESEVAQTRESPRGSGLAERISIAKHVQSGGWLNREMFEPRAVLLNWIAGTKTIHAAYKDLRRRDRFSADFRPTPYDVWSFRHDRAFGIPHAGSIPAAIIAHTLYYYTQPDALVVDPMAGGGTTLDVCQSMGRRCLAYDIQPVRPEISRT